MSLSQHIQLGYQLFNRYSIHFPLQVCTCSACMSEDEQRYFMKIPLNQISANEMYAYLTSVPSANDVAAIDEKKHFLPRIMELLAKNEEIHTLYEHSLNKLMFNRRDCWQSNEIEWIIQFARLWWEERFQNNLGYGLNDALIFVYAGLIELLPEYLILWCHYAHQPIALAEFADWCMKIEYGSHTPTWGIDPEFTQHNDIIQILNQWFSDIHTQGIFQTAFEERLLAGLPEEWAHLTAYWETVYDYLSNHI